MCGIAGKIYFAGGQVTENALGQMSREIIHRGPDDTGIYINTDKKAGLAHRRLAIVDLTSAGHQPMSYKNRYWIVYNGEIYNWKSLRGQFKSKFKSNSDTEVLLLLYGKYREKMVDYLRGMFAFAIWDDQEKVLFAARDRLGKKPFKYFINQSVFIFASELKAILTQPEVTTAPDWQAISDYLTLGYCPAPTTGFENIYKLEPGHYLKIDCRKKLLEKKRYWQLNYKTKLKLTEGEWTERIIRELNTAVKIRMEADVPIGLFLSGGTDSSLVAGLMAENSNKPIRTFSIIFNDKKFNEAEYALRMAKICGSDHMQIEVNPENLEILPKLIYQLEEPFANASSLISFLVSQAARKYVKVALNGDGGDENFAGYDRYLRVNRDQLLWPYRNVLRAAAGMMPEKYKKYARSLGGKYAEKYVSYNQYFTSSVANYEPAWRWYEKFFRGGIMGDEATETDINMYLPGDLLAKADMTAMAVGLEGRSPFLDYKIVEMAAQIPFGLKVKNGVLKYILKKAAEKYVPIENLYRKKMGFSVPLAEWFTGDLNKYARSILLGKKSITGKLFSRDYIAEMLTTHTVSHDFGPRLWNLLVLELWFQRFFPNSGLITKTCW